MACCCCDACFPVTCCGAPDRLQACCGADVLHAEDKQAVRQAVLSGQAEEKSRRKAASTREQALATADGEQEPAAKRQRAELASTPKEKASRKKPTTTKNPSPHVLAAEPEGTRITAHRQVLTCKRCQ